MKNMIDKRLNIITLGSILLDVVFILLGFFFMSNPEISSQLTGMLLGLLLVISGIYAIIKFITNMKFNLIFSVELIYGIISFIVGTIIVFNPTGFANLITVFIGIWFLVSGVIKAIISIMMKNINEDSWLFNFVIAVLTIVIGILLIVNPFSGKMVITIYAGIMLVIYSAIDMVNQLILRKKAKVIENILFK